MSSCYYPVELGWDAKISGLRDDLEVVIKDGIPTVRSKYLYSHPEPKPIFVMDPTPTLTPTPSPSLENVAESLFKVIVEAFDFSEFRRFATDWQDVITEVNSLHDPRGERPEGISSRAAVTALAILSVVNLCRPNIAKPMITTGDGDGVHIEWETGQAFVSVLIRNDNTVSPDTVYFETGDSFANSPLDGGAFENALKHIA